MPKIPYKAEKSGENEDDYEIVSFEDFCDKSPGSKTDLLTLNDNINYRLCFEGDKKVKYSEGLGESSRGADLKETSLSGPKENYKRRLSNSFAPFGKYTGKGSRSPLFSGVIPKPREDGDDNTIPSREHRYERFSDRRSVIRRFCESARSMGGGALGIALVCAVCVGAWWAVSSAVAGDWADQHYKKLWERAHPETVKAPITPLQLEKPVTEHRYHDHNNLSTKNRNASESKKTHKKNYNPLTPEQMKEACARVGENMRFDCYPYPLKDATEANCKARGCCWSPAKTKGAPYCFYPPGYTNYQFVNMTEDKHSVTVHYQLARPSHYPGDFAQLRMDFKYLSDDALQVKIYDAEHKRFEPPYPEMSTVPKTISDLKYRVMIEGSMTGFRIVRNSDNVTIFNTQDVGGLILSDKFLQMSAILPSDHIYGLGEKRARFMHDMNWQTFAIYNRDRVPEEGKNVYGSHPFYLSVEHGGAATGALLLNANAMDIVLQPTPAITYRTIGGVLDFYIIVGSSPAAVVSRYTELVGRPAVPPYWGLGFHLCKFDYGSLNVTRQVWQANRDAGIPFDVQWNDIDYMHNHNDFTYDTVKYAGLDRFVRQVHEAGMRYVVIIDPGIGASEKPGTYPPYDRGIEMDIFVKNSTNKPFVGKVWNTGNTVFPDFTHPNSTAYWVEMMTEFHKKIPYDGAWIDMNEPSNFRNAYDECEPENLPYLPSTKDQYLHEHTLCMEARQYAGPHYDNHNLYSITEAVATHYALSEIRGKRPFIISRASFVGQGQYSGHWSGDIVSTWHDMRMTIPELLSFSIFGIPLMGADICGFVGNTTAELCTRWMQLGAFYPFSRNHNSDTSIPQDPVSLGPSVVEASRKALRTRYTLLPYYYTLFWRAHTRGDTVARPLFFEWPEQSNLHDIDDQFLIGPYIMITPILNEGARTAKVFFPLPQTWYKLDGTKVGSGIWIEVDEDSTVSVRGGAILPLQTPPSTGPVSTSNSRSGPLQLVVVPDNEYNACGDIYWDDGESSNSYQEKKYSYIEFYHNYTEFRTAVRWWGYGVPSLEKITFFNQQPVKTVIVNNQTCKTPCEFSYNTAKKLLELKNSVIMNKVIRGGAREIIYKVFMQCMAKYQAGNLLTELDDVYKRTADSTGVSESTVRRIVNHGIEH